MAGFSDKYAPSYENNISTNMPGYTVSFQFPTVQDPRYKQIDFSAYVKKVGDNFNIMYDPKKVYGRMDPIPIYGGTTRTISFDLDIPSNGLAHSREIAAKLNVLVKNLYPSYQQQSNVGTSKIIASPPLVKVKFSSFISEINNDYVLGFFSKAIDITHDLGANGVFVRAAGNEAYAKVYSLNFAINVLHKETPGFYNVNGVVSNPINILLPSK